MTIAGLPSLSLIASTMPVVSPVASVIVTCRPRYEGAEASFWSVVKDSKDFERVRICSSEVKFAICDMNSVSFIGFIGSWEVNCVVRSFIKSSAPSICFPVFFCIAKPVIGSLAGVDGFGVTDEIAIF